MAAVRSPAITVGGHVVRDPADAIADYLHRYGGTVTHYDFLAGTFDQIDPGLVRATRSPWMGSRISAKEAAWLIDRGTTAPWAAVPLDAQLKDADPRAIDVIPRQTIAPAAIDHANEIRIRRFVLNLRALVDMRLGRIAEHVIQIRNHRCVTKLSELVSRGFQIPRQARMLMNEQKTGAFLGALRVGDETLNAVLLLF